MIRSQPISILAHRVAPAALVVCAALCGCAQQKPTDILRSEGMAHYNDGDYAEAARSFGTLVDEYPGDWEGQLMYGRITDGDRPV